MTIGERIKKIRAEKGILQREIAEALYVDVTLVCRWEKGTRKIPSQHLLPLATFLNVNVDELLKGE